MDHNTEELNLKDFFLQDKPTSILLEIKRRNGEKYASILSREVGCTYSHTVKVLSTLKEVGLIDFEKEGRKKLIELTEKGQKIADNIEKLVKSLNGSNPNN